MQWVKDSWPRLLSLQDVGANSLSKGCFFYPHWQGKKKFCNARWQEAVASLAWVYDKGIRSRKEDELIFRIKAGIDFWCKIQNRNGSFPEYTRYDHSYAATAYSTYAISHSMNIIGVQEDWLNHLIRAGRWLCKNREKYLTNQESMAALTLLKIYELTKEEKFLACSQEKLDRVLSSGYRDGFFTERKGIDLGYSSLTLSILGNFYLIMPEPKILEAAKGFIANCNELIYPDGSFGGTYNTRQLGWLILDGFEIFSPLIPQANSILEKVIDGYQNGIGYIQHLPDERHLCTDLYKICQAYDHVKAYDLGDEYNSSKMGIDQNNLKVIRRDSYLVVTDSEHSKLFALWTRDGMKFFFDPSYYNLKAARWLDILRPLGLHRLRGLKYKLLSAKETGDRHYDFQRDCIIVNTKLQKDELFFAYKSPYGIEINNNALILKDQNTRIKISSTGAISYEDLGIIALSDSIFYGDRALGFLKIRLEAQNPFLNYILRID